MEPEVIYTCKRNSCNDDDNESYVNSIFKRRLVSLSSTEEDLEEVKNKIGMVIIRQFGNSEGIFKEIARSDTLYLYDFLDYLHKHKVTCSLNQLSLILKPYLGSNATLTLENFQLFAKDITSSQANGKLVQAFPDTFGYSMHISIDYGQKEIIDQSQQQEEEEEEGTMRRVPSVAQNLNNLPIYKFMLGEKNECVPPTVYPIQSQEEEEEDALFI